MPPRCVSSATMAPAHRHAIGLPLGTAMLFLRPVFFWQDASSGMSSCAKQATPEQEKRLRYFDSLFRRSKHAAMGMSSRAPVVGSGT